MGVSAAHVATIEAFVTANKTKQILLSDFRRQMLPGYDAMVTDEKSPIFRYAKRAFFIVDRQGVLRYKKIQDNALDLMKPDDILKALKESGA